MKLKTNGTKTNWWKWACLLILAINVAFVGVIASRLIQVREPAAQTITSKKAKSVKVGTVSTTREQLNNTVASYLKDYQTKIHLTMFTQLHQQFCLKELILF